MASASKDKTSLRANTSTLLARATYAALAGLQFGKTRDVYEEYGYKRTPEFHDYFARYRRQDIAARIVDMPATDTWSEAPAISDDEDPNSESRFEKAWLRLQKRLQVWETFERADKLAGIGHYATLLIGARGNIAAPLPERAGDDILYLSVYAEPNAQIAKYVGDTADPRFGLPESYNLTLQADLTGAGGPASRTRLTKQARDAHWSRVIHVPGDLLEDDVWGRPRLERVFNLLFDLEKTVGASAEMFYRGGFGGKQFDMDPEIELRAEDEAALADELDEYQHRLRRFIRTRGVSVNDLTGQLGDPRGVFEVIIQLISAATGIPQRMLMGSERGQLASEQDTVQWRSRVRHRQERVAEPLVVRPFIDRLIERGYLPEPQGGEYEVRWPPIAEQTAGERANVVGRLARAARDYSQASGGQVFLGIDDMREVLQLKSGAPEQPPRRPNGTGNGSFPLSGERDVADQDTSVEAHN